MKKTYSQTSGSMHQKTDGVGIERDHSIIKNHAPKSLIIAPINSNTNNSNYNQTLEPPSIKIRPSVSSQNTNNWDSQYNRLSIGVKELFMEMRKRTVTEVYHP